jgi:hypothetical protein
MYLTRRHTCFDLSTACSPNDLASPPEADPNTFSAKPHFKNGAEETQRITEAPGLLAFSSYTACNCYRHFRNPALMPGSFHDQFRRIEAILT